MQITLSFSGITHYNSSLLLGSSNPPYVFFTELCLFCFWRVDVVKNDVVSQKINSHGLSFQSPSPSTSVCWHISMTQLSFWPSCKASMLSLLHYARVTHIIKNAEAIDLAYSFLPNRRNSSFTEHVRAMWVWLRHIWPFSSPYTNSVGAHLSWLSFPFFPPF